MSNSFEDKVYYLADLVGYAGMADIDPLLKAHRKVFAACVAYRDNEPNDLKVSRVDMESLWDTVCAALKMDPNVEYLDWENHVSGDAFMTAYYKKRIV